MRGVLNLEAVALRVTAQVAYDERPPSHTSRSIGGGYCDGVFAIHCYVHALAANLISAGVLLIPPLEPVVAETAERALVTALDEVGGAAMRADLASMLHEAQYTRLFRS
jgi:hypothetical protein